MEALLQIRLINLIKTWCIHLSSLIWSYCFQMNFEESMILDTRIEQFKKCKKCTGYPVILTRPMRHNNSNDRPPKSVGAKTCQWYPHMKHQLIWTFALLRRVKQLDVNQEIVGSCLAFRVDYHWYDRRPGFNAVNFWTRIEHCIYQRRQGKAAYLKEIGQ